MHWFNRQVDEMCRSLMERTLLARNSVVDQLAGQGLVEYALILVLVAIAVIAVLAFFGGTLNETFVTINCSVEAGAGLAGANCTP